MRPAPASWFFCLWLLLAALPALSAPQYPALSGRIVDQADLLSPAAEGRLTEKLEAHERGTSNQVVVVTLPSLAGSTIEEYGYQLGRHWGIGQEGRDNGALLIVAVEERAVRIEVGYGLEGVLTDAISHNIIQTTILPAFGEGQFERGIEAGTEAILGAIAGTYEPLPEPTGEGDGEGNLFATLLFFSVVAGQFLYALTRNRLVSGLVTGSGAGALGFVLLSLPMAILIAIMAFLIPFLMGGNAGRGGRWPGGAGGYGGPGFRAGGSFGGGGFSGGGGSFGGGGASGRW